MGIFSRLRVVLVLTDGDGVRKEISDAVAAGDHDKIDRSLWRTGAPGARVDRLNKEAHGGRVPSGWDVLTTHIPERGDKAPWEW